MKTFRLLGLSAVLVLTLLAQARPALAACGFCNTNTQCQVCTGDPGAACLGHRCAL